MGHAFRRSTFGTNVVCDSCGLLPLDQDDIESSCCYAVSGNAFSHDTQVSDAIDLAGANIDAMVQGYLECQLWAGLDCREDGEEPVPYDDNYDISDISPDYVDKITDEFRELVYAHPLAVRMYLNTVGKYDQTGYERNGTFGHNYYLTREGHGAGFWDRGLGELGDYLTDIAKYAGSADDLWDNGDGVLR